MNAGGLFCIRGAPTGSGSAAWGGIAGVGRDDEEEESKESAPEELPEEPESEPGGRWSWNFERNINSFMF